MYDAEKNILKLLMYESDQVVSKIEVELQEDPNRFRQKLGQLENKYVNVCKLLDRRRSKKWQKFKITAKSRIQNNIILAEKVTKNNDSTKTSLNQSENYPNNETTF